MKMEIDKHHRQMSSNDIREEVDKEIPVEVFWEIKKKESTKKIEDKYSREEVKIKSIQFTHAQGI